MQYLRKSNLLKKGINLGKYVNAILNILIDTSGSAKNYTLEIYGSCWAKLNKPKSINYADELVDIVFENIPKNLKIKLINSYPGFSSEAVKKSLISRNYHSVSRITGNDHAKILKLYNNRELIFWMIGSTNFSKNSYLAKNNIDQCEVAFIKNIPSTNRLISAILHNPTNNAALLNIFVELTETNIDINEQNDTDKFVKIIRDDTILNMPFISNKDDENL